MIRFRNAKFRSVLVVSTIFVVGIVVPINFVQAQDNSSSDPIRIVNCTDKVPSHKRGVCANRLSAEDFRALAPGVSWYYNWHFNNDGMPVPSDVSMEFVPQAWGNGPGYVEGLRNYLSSAPKKPRAVLAINEPNLKGQAFINPETTADAYNKIKAVADEFQLPVIGPNMALGSGEGSSIKAQDPIENKLVTYTFFVPFLKAFFFYMNNNPVSGLAIHSYGNLGEMQWGVKSMNDTFQLPVWVTEYAYWGASSQDEALDYMCKATDFFEKSPFVQGYAWFKERADNKNISLLEKDPGKLTALGKAYVNLPSHEANIYYRIPGKLAAVNYVEDFKEEIRMTKDKDSDCLFDMVATGSGGTINYNLQVDNPGVYTLNVHLGGPPAKIDILENGQVLGSIDVTQPGWKTLSASVQLPAGTQTLQFQLGLGNQAINWIQFDQGTAPATPATTESVPPDQVTPTAQSTTPSAATN